MFRALRILAALLVGVAQPCAAGWRGLAQPIRAPNQAIPVLEVRPALSAAPLAAATRPLTTVAALTPAVRSLPGLVQAAASTEDVAVLSESFSAFYSGSLPLAAEEPPVARSAGAAAPLKAASRQAAVARQRWSAKAGIGKRLAVGAMAMLLFSCAHMLPAQNLRAPEKMPPDIAARYAPAAVLDRDNPLERVEVSIEGRYTVETGRFASHLMTPGGYKSAWEQGYSFYAPKTDGRAALIVVFPVIRGEVIGEWIAASLAKHGHNVLLIRGDNSDELLPTKTAADLENDLQNRVARTRSMLDWFIERRDVDAERIGFVGISMGGIQGIALLAAEPRITRSVILLAGSDIPRIMLTSREIGVSTYMRERQKGGLSAEDIAAEFARETASDPALLAKYIDPSGMLFVRALLDGVVMPRFSKKLWRQAGKPERIDIYSTHYTSILFFPYLFSKMNGHFEAWPKNATYRDDEAATRPMTRK